MTRRLLPACTICAACLCAVAAPVPVSAQATSAQSHDGAWTPAAPAATGSPFERLFADTVRDFGRIPSRETVTLLSLGMTAALIGHQADGSISRGMSGSPVASAAFAVGETLGSAPVQFAGAAATYAVGRFTSPRTAAIGADLIRAQILTQTLTFTLKTAAGRTRPDGTRHSFPSGHSSTTFATATVIQRHLGWKAGVPAYAVASYVAASRIQDRRHFLSDVTFGAALGIVAGRTVTFGRGHHRFAVAPSAVPGGGGVSFTWID